MTLEFNAGAQLLDSKPARRPESKIQFRLTILRDAILAICDGNWDQAEEALARDSQFASRDAVCLNLRGVICQARHQWRPARRFFGKAMRANRNYLPPEQNLRRFYELDTFGKTHLPIALADQATIARLRNLPNRNPDRQLNAQMLKRISHSISADATMENVSKAWDWRGYAWAIATVALSTAIGWPLVHAGLHVAGVNILMFYLLGVLWVATRYSRGAAVAASILGVATFDFVFVQPYYTMAVADEQYLVTFAVMLLTALVISTLTHRVRHEAELARQAWERVEVEFLRNTLLSGVSHELRTPLAAITGAASSLIETGAGLSRSTQSELLTTIYSESDRMERLITNLLDMTRMEAGGLVLRKEWLPVQEVIGSALQHLDRRLLGREVKADLPRDLPLVHMDGALIEQVMTNLIDNAIEYTPNESPIEISASVRDQEIAIEVADRGPGLPPGTEKRVFEKFFRIGSPENRRGIGLGLAIAQGVVEAHGGTIFAANRPGGGALFRFTLPLSGTRPEMDSSG